VSTERSQLRLGRKQYDTDVMVEMNDWATKGETMRRVVLLLGMGCLTALCSSGVWLAFRPPIQSLVPPDATEVHMSANGWWEWRLSYRTRDPPYGWYTVIVHQLEAGGWVRRAAGYTGRPLQDPVGYTRITSFGFAVLTESVELGGDLYVADVRMRRWIALP
jgi:hypothetical protein